jgi:hypothetical protein
MVKFIKENKLLIGASLLAIILFLPKKIKAASNFQLQDFYRDGAGNYISMVSGTSYNVNDTVGRIVNDPDSDVFNDVVIKSNSKNIYHIVNRDIAKKLFLEYGN